MRSQIRRSRKRVLGFENLESMTLLSGLAAPAVSRAAVGLVHVEAARPALSMAISTRGFFSAIRQNPNAGATYFFYTSGFSPALGYSIIAGSITTTGNVAHGRATGHMVVYSSKGGTMNLALTGPLQQGFAPPPAALTWQVTASSGVFLHATGQGTMTDALHRTWGTLEGPRTFGGGFATLTFRGLVRTA